MVQTKRLFRLVGTLMVSALGFANCTKPDDPEDNTIDPWMAYYGPFPPSSYMETLPVSDDPVAEAALNGVDRSYNMRLTRRISPIDYWPDE